ncbi:hypothetical protein PZE06_14280 [Robertmurraya sp. DFI.2.37]|uniref:hypothetical protein n=1 Tax=Robertmurraya sp. DFI.2.37 TaxID=3031819 RepID=UPI0012445D3D|nr:hypothetical protein [Robertmurraya sp. DFI.2.37]MDF1509335.1 hypothetical protein [Robertmurraya sp. DFI.2.37]
MNTKQLNKFFSRMGEKNIIRSFVKPRSRNKSGWLFLALSGVAAVATVMFRRNNTEMNGNKVEPFKQGKKEMSFPPLKQMLTAEFAEEFFKKNNKSSTANSYSETKENNQQNDS